MTIEASILLKVLADGPTLKILDHIVRSYEAGEVNGTSVPISKTSLTRRQYYRRLSMLAKMGLIVRKNNGKYSITLFGRLINAQIVSIAMLVNQYWKIQAIDSIKFATANDDNSDNQFIQFINTIIQDDHLKRLLSSSYSLGTDSTSMIAAKHSYQFHTP